MAENKTQPTTADPRAFVEAVEHPTRRADGLILLELFEEVTGERPTMWGPSIIGYGTYHYKYDSGREGDMCRTGFSPRKSNLALYIHRDFAGADDMLARLGKHKTGAGCTYVNKLADIDLAVLKELIAAGWAEMNRKYPQGRA